MAWEAYWQKAGAGFPRSSSSPLVVALNKAGFITGECVAIDGGRQCLGAR